MRNVLKIAFYYPPYIKNVNDQLLLFVNSLKYINNLEIFHFGRYLVNVVATIYRWE